MVVRQRAMAVRQRVNTTIYSILLHTLIQVRSGKRWYNARMLAHPADADQLYGASPAHQIQLLRARGALL